MSIISEITIQAVNDRSDALTIIGEYVRLEKRGGRYWGLCPFHSEKTASFSVDPEKRFYYCFGCGKGGGIISFLMEAEKITFPEAVERLAKKFNIPIIKEGTKSSQITDAITHNKAEILFELYNRVAGSFHHIFKKTEQSTFAREYVKSRAINDEMANLFKLGYSPTDRSWLFGFLLKKGYSEALLNESGLFSQKFPKISFFSDRLMFPIADRDQRTIAFGGRIMRGEGPKYINSSESIIFKKSENLYALDFALPEIRRNKYAYICEGYIDAIALHQAGIRTAVAPLGTAFTENQAKLLRRWVEKVILVFDSDNAGVNATVKAILTCRRLALPCGIVSIKGGKDPADILRDYGDEALHKAMECYINDFDYLMDLAGVRFDKTETEGLAQAIAFLFPYVQTLDSEVEKGACVGMIADAFGVDRTAVHRDFINFIENKTGKYQNKIAESSNIKMNDELFLMTAVAFNRVLFRKLRASISINDIDDPNAKEIFVALEECFRAEIDTIDELMSKIENVNLRIFMLERGSSGMYSTNIEKLVSDGIERIKRNSFGKRRSEILIKMRNSDKDNMKMLEDYLSEIQYIDNEIARLKDANE